MMGLKLDDLIKAAEAQGWRKKDTKMGVLLLPPDPTKTSVLAHRDPPEHTLKKILSQLRQRGFRWPPE